MPQISVTFDEVQLSVRPSAVSGGPQASTLVISNPFSGLSQRNVSRLDPVHLFSIQHAYLSNSELNELRTFWHCRNGNARGFRFKDWSEYWASIDGTIESPIATPNNFGTGDGVTTVFGLYKTYTSGGVTRTRRIVKPVSGTVSIYKNGSLQTLTTHYTISYTTGIVTFVSAPANGHALTWTGEFDVPCYFALPNDQFAPSIGDAISDISYQSLQVVEIPAAAFNLSV